MKLMQICEENLVRAALRQDDIYKHIIAVENLETWTPDMKTCLWYVAEVDNEFVGLIIIKQRTSVLLEYHGGVYDKFRRKSFQYTREALQEAKNLFKTKFMTYVSTSNRPSQHLVARLGFERVGVIKKGCNDGDMIIYAEKE